MGFIHRMQLIIVLRIREEIGVVIMSSVDVFEKFICVLPQISELFLSGVGISITDREKFLFYKPGLKMDLKQRTGEIRHGFSE